METYNTETIVWKPTTQIQQYGNLQHRDNSMKTYNTETIVWKPTTQS